MTTFQNFTNSCGVFGNLQSCYLFCKLKGILVTQQDRPVKYGQQAMLKRDHLGLLYFAKQKQNIFVRAPGHF